MRQTTWVDEHVIASPDFVVSYVCHSAAQLIGFNDIFKGKKLKGNKAEETNLSKVLTGQLQSIYCVTDSQVILKLFLSAENTDSLLIYGLMSECRSKNRKPCH